MCFNDTFEKLPIIKYFSDDFLLLIIWNKMFYLRLFFRFDLEHAIRKM